MAAGRIVHLSLDERTTRGREARVRTPVDSHTGWRPAVDRPDPLVLLAEQDLTREPDLVPVRRGRMLASPFAFYRGAAKIMAADLKDTPTAGLHVQLCGDAHLLNFGAYASPERTLMFDLNDFDETLPGPFEYDVQRMAASFTIAARNNGFSRSDAREAARASVMRYREAMAMFAQMRTMDVWYAHLSQDMFMDALRSSMAETTEAVKGKKAKKQAEKLGRRVEKTAVKAVAKARSRDSLQALSKLGEWADGRYRIVSRPPIVVPARELAAARGLSRDEVERLVHEQFRAYRATLQDDRRHLLEQFRVVDVAHKVVGVGSVGTRAFIVLLQGRDAHDPLFLQVKEATASVLEGYLPKSRYQQHGERVVQGQRLMQAASDIFLGWTRGLDVTRHFYWRQLRDMKGSAVIEDMTPTGLALYARACGWTLARAHARSGDPIAIAGYLGDSDGFDRSIVEFSDRYADQNEQDFERFVADVRSGLLEATEGV